MRSPFGGTPIDFNSLIISQTADATLVHADAFAGAVDIKLNGLHTQTANDFILT